MLRISALAASAALVLAACSTGTGDADSGGSTSSTSEDGVSSKKPSSGSITLDGEGKPEDGIATYYAATGAGNCSFEATPNDLDVAAMNAEQYDGSAVCGGCVKVNGPKGELVVRVVDQCPECKSGHLDLSKEAFAKIAEVSAGRVPITWTRVTCALDGPVRYHFKDGSSQWWTAIQVRNHRVPIAKLEIKAKGGDFREVPREDYNYFVEQDGVGEGPFTVRLTGSNGAVLEDTLDGVVAETTVDGARQFP